MNIRSKIEKTVNTLLSESVDYNSPAIVLNVYGVIANDELADHLRGIISNELDKIQAGGAQVIPDEDNWDVVWDIPTDV